MASITSLSNSSYSSSIYGSRNVLSGLASGMDTEQMIENAVSGIKLKIQNLQKKRTKIEWQQEAYRSIIDKMVNLDQKYSSYSSSTNLLSNSFFSNAVNSVTKGTYADKVTATGKTSSDVRINAVRQLATAASYTVSGLGGSRSGELQGITAGKGIDLSQPVKESTVSGTLTLKYGGSNGTSFDISFGELENLDEVKVLDGAGNEKADATDAEKLAQAIKNKLGEIEYKYTENGLQNTKKGNEVIKVEVGEDGTIKFSDGLNKGNNVTLSATGKMKDSVGGDTITTPESLTKDVEAKENLAKKTLSVSFNGTTKNISMDKVLEKIADVEPENANEKFAQALQEEMDSAFGAGKINVSRSDDGRLSFTPKSEGDTMVLSGDAVESLGFQNGDANYLNTGKKLTDLLGEDKVKEFFSDKNRLGAVGKVNEDKLLDEAGNKVKKGDDGEYYRVNNDGKFLYDFKVNGVSISVNEDSTLESVMTAINSNADAGVKVSYSKLTNEFKFTATETGANSKIEFDGLAKDLFGDTSASKPNVTSSTKLSDVLGTGLSGKFEIKLGDETISVNRDDNSDVGGTVYWLNEKIKENGNLEGVTASFDYDKNTFVFKGKDGKEMGFEYGVGMAQNFAAAVKDKYTAGQDAIIDVEINGKKFEGLTRSGNTFDIDGMNVTVKGTFEVAKGEDAVTFETSTDTDKIVDAIKAFVNDYNEMVTELKNAYSTLPGQTSSGARYEPLSAEEEDKYSESELKAYNEKAKQGILFGDRDLSRAYDRLRSAISPSGADGVTLREIGLDTNYSGGLTTIELDEKKLRAALESDPDKVRNAFTKTKENGASSDGLMTNLKNTLDTYAKATGEPKGVLIQKAGSIKSPTSLNNNTLLSQMNNLDNQIERWQDKMADQIDRYTSQFSKLEQLIAEMNSQSSALMGLMGGSSGY